MERTINTIIIQVTKLAGKKSDNIIILSEIKRNVSIMIRTMDWP